MQATTTDFKTPFRGQGVVLSGPFVQLLTMDKLPLRGALKDEDLEIIYHAGIVHKDGKIVEIGGFEALKQKYPDVKIDLYPGDSVCLPAMIDVHTHICWAGSRAKDYALRLAGKSYLEIAAAGGGIWDTVTKTRAASLDELVQLTVMRANELYNQGIGTIEVKSGYGLSVAEELKILEAIRFANEQTPADLIPTCLAAHIIPKDFPGNETDYLKMISEELLPEVKRRNLANRVDIFVEESAFSVSAARNYLQKAKSLGFDILLHGDQFTAGSAALANEVGALSIDHLEAANEDEINILAQGNTIPVVLPAASLGLGEPFAPARKLLDAGTSLVIASDWNPGSAPMGDLLTAAAILGAAQHLSMSEVWAAITCRAALALNKTDRGILKTGYCADFITFQTNDFREILYRQGGLSCKY
ncbi:imidazolonepropionase [Bacteroidia bacterium]|nr:imidazolonepropionase [Bacteroidia bacterium]